MLASYHVIKEILKKWKNLEELRREFEKFSNRYPEDDEFQKIFLEFEKYLKKKKSEDLDKIKKKLKSLQAARKVDSSGGTGYLPYSDYRHLSEDYERGGGARRGV